MFHFDSDEDIFCVFSQYIDDLMLLVKMLIAVCNDEKLMCNYLDMGSKKTNRYKLYALGTLFRKGINIIFLCKIEAFDSNNKGDKNKEGPGK